MPTTEEPLWESTSIQNLIRYRPSGTYFARFKVGGKLVRQSLETAVFSVAKQRLPDKIREYEQRMALEKDKNAYAIMANAQKEEFKHFSMDLEWLLRAKPIWREIAQGVLFTEGDIVKRGERAEEKA
jgi:uncharacterized protein